MKRILLLLTLLTSLFNSSIANAFPWWTNNGDLGPYIYYCPDNNNNSFNCNPMTEWGCANDLTVPTYTGASCIIPPAATVCTPPAINDRNVYGATYNTCLTPPTGDYDCDSPKEWVYTAESAWRCVISASLTTCGSAPYAATKAGACSSGGGIYHSTSFARSMICDPAISYECVTPGTDCSFWDYIIGATCTN